MDNSQATSYLTSLLGKLFRITTMDKRMFLGQFKCTDLDLNVVLAQTHEYRLPQLPQSTVRRSSSGHNQSKLDLSSRYLGLVIIPGKYITKIEVEEFASQLRGTGLIRRQGVEVEGINLGTQISREDVKHAMVTESEAESDGNFGTEGRRMVKDDGT